VSASGIKSKPVYSPLRADTRGRYHLLLGFGPGAAALLRVIAELQAAAPDSPQRTQLLYVPDGDATAQPFHGLGLSSVQSFDDPAALLAALRNVLGNSLMGTRLYVAGPEHFIGRALTIALEFNMSKDEIGAEESGTLARRLYCVHCQTTTEGVRTNIAACSGCGRWLMVRDHYSRRLAAYMGVMVDAEAPGELPPIEELYS
jgi:dimethylamine monooxygenase subunit C